MACSGRYEIRRNTSGGRVGHEAQGTLSSRGQVAVAVLRMTGFSFGRRTSVAAVLRVHSAVLSAVTTCTFVLEVEARAKGMRTCSGLR